MHLLALYLLLVPSLACALGAEDTEFFGLIETNTILKIAFVEDPQPWSKQHPIYGSPNSKPFSFCWVELLGQDRQCFTCANSRGSKPNVSYRILGSPNQSPKYNAQTPAGQEYLSITKKEGFGNGAKRGDGKLEAIYDCKTGCAAGVPRYIFEVAKYD